MISAFQVVYGSLFHTTRHSERSEGATHVDTLDFALSSTRHSERSGATHVDTLDFALSSTRHSERSEESHQALHEILRLKPQGATHVNMSNNNRRAAFTLAEVLITLGIIGIVAAMTIPTVVSKIQDMVYKTAYKTAFSDLNQAFKMLTYEGTQFQKIVYLKDENGNPRPGVAPAYGENFKILAQYFKATKTCFDHKRGDLCWKCKGGEQANTTYTDSEWKGTRECTGEAYSFVDAQGRNWAMYSNNEPVFLVDTNGFKGPNQLGKDRFPFAMAASSEKGNFFSNAIPDSVIPGQMQDYTYKTRWCPSGECYYISWIYGRKYYKN